MLKPVDLKVGDIFYECYSGVTVEMVVETAPVFETVYYLNR